jgi:hypothetical protein
VLQDDARTSVFLDDGKGGAGDACGVQAQPAGEAADKGGLSGAEVAVEQYDRARRKPRAERVPGGDSVCLGRG